MKSKKDLSMNDFYDFSSCNYLTTFYASTEKYCGIIHDDETRRKARAYIKGLFSGDYSNEDITFPVVYREDPYESGKKFRDILDNRSRERYLISDRFRHALEESGITGWKCYPIELYDKKGNKIDGYHGLSIIGRAGRMQRYERPPLELGYSPDSDGCYFDLSTWDGSDMFILEASRFLIVTQAFVDMLRKYKITACTYIKLTDYGDITKYKRIH